MVRNQPGCGSFRELPKLEQRLPLSVLANELPAAYLVLMKLPVVMHTGEDGWIVAECPIIPGCVSQGKTHDEALANIREAIELCLENREREGWSLPSEYEVVNVDIDVAA